MDKFFRYNAYLIAILQVGVGIFVFSQGYSSKDMLVACLLLILPIVSILAIQFSPDMEERRLTRAVNKARLKKELTDLEKKQK